MCTSSVTHVSTRHAQALATAAPLVPCADSHVINGSFNDTRSGSWSCSPAPGVAIEVEVAALSQAVSECIDQQGLLAGGRAATVTPGLVADITAALAGCARAGLAPPRLMRQAGLLLTLVGGVSVQ
jgi:hypothetical protein